MKISSIELAGFRGIKQKLKVSIPSGFAVISGRNGSGKSTLCDAIEFILTGTLERYSASKDDLESVEDYLWWRGEGKAPERYVRVGFVGEDGHEVICERTPGQKSVRIEDRDFVNSLCGRLGENQSTTLSSTTILRDETISRLGLDMTGVQRFAFTKMALGVSDFTTLEAKASDALTILEKRKQRADGEYRASRIKLNELIATASEIRVEVSETGDVHAAEMSLRRLTGKPDVSVAEVLNASRQELRQIRRSVDVGLRILKDLRGLEQYEREIESPEFLEREKKAESVVKDLKIRLDRILDQEENVEAELAGFRQEDSRLSDLAQLHEIGKRLGLQAGVCPLCGSDVSAKSFEQNISKTRSHILEHSRRLNDLVQKVAELKQERFVITQELYSAESRLSEMLQAAELVSRNQSDLISEAHKYGYALEANAATSAILESMVESKREQSSEFELALGTVEATSLVERLSDLERQVAIARDQGEAAEKRLKKIESIISQAKNTRADIRRFSGEIVEERLAELTPLLGELFVRLKPHLSWPELSYHLRGDVRHFLSLQVGEQLNPKFFFSTGQRRAAGLAFLLAVHLSRNWCSLDSLMLDDPVQHIDDYRALHLVEVLSAIRQAGRQIVCTAEDVDLAHFLSRRLRCSAPGEGSFIEMEYSIDAGVRVANETKIDPLPQQVLLAAAAG